MAYPTVSAPYGLDPINRFDGIPYAGGKVNGTLTVSENIADAGDKVLKEGRKMAKQAAEAAEQGMATLEKMAPKVPTKGVSQAAAPAKKARKTKAAGGASVSKTTKAAKAKKATKCAHVMFKEHPLIVHLRNPALPWEYLTA